MKEIQKINKVDIAIKNFCVACGHYHCMKNKRWGCIHNGNECNCRKFVGRRLKGSFVAQVVTIWCRLAIGLRGVLIWLTKIEIQHDQDQVLQQLHKL